MTLTGPDTRPAEGTPEEFVLSSLRSAGYAIRYEEPTAVYRIVEPRGLDRAGAVVGLVIVRNRRIVFAEFLRRLYPYWGRAADTNDYREVLVKLMDDIEEGRRK